MMGLLVSCARQVVEDLDFNRLLNAVLDCSSFKIPIDAAHTLLNQTPVGWYLTYIG